MRKVVISLIVFGITLVIFGAPSAPKSTAYMSSAIDDRDTITQNTPGTRCTRLLYGPRVKGAGELGSRCGRLFSGPRKGKVLPNQPPRVELKASVESITLPCKPGTASTSCTTDPCQIVILSAPSSDPDGDNLLYTYSVTGGSVTGEGAAVIWDLKGADPGTYTAATEVDDGCGCISFANATVSVAACGDCK